MDDHVEKRTSKVLEIFMKVLFIGLGILLGHLAAFVIALFAGWVDFC